MVASKGKIATRIVASTLVRSLPRKKRTIAQFAEDEIVIPTGPFEGRPFRIEYQPFARLWFDCVDDSHYNELSLLGPVQSGKTTIGFSIPILWHLFEIGENVIVVVPRKSPDAFDKWKQDLEPMIRRTRFARLMPTEGIGSGGGKFDSITFRNGRTLKFMSGRGKDEERSGFTARVVFVTEADKVARRSEASLESSPMKQVYARTKAYGARRRFYKESTVTIESGEIYHSWKSGTASEIYLECPHCNGFVFLDRGDLVGYQDCETIGEIASAAHYACPECSARWTETDRRLANDRSILLHGGQTIEEGKIVGKPKQTRSLGFRYRAPNNMFLTAADVAEDEWKAPRSEDPEDSERYVLQFIWAEPYKSPEVDLTTLITKEVAARVIKTPRGFIPDGYPYLVAAADVGKWAIHWVIIAASERADLHVVDYGVYDVPSREMALELAVTMKLQQFQESIEAGYKCETGETMVPQIVVVDSGWQGKKADPYFVYEFCNEAGEKYQPAKGYGAGQYAGESYNSPTKITNDIRFIGEGWHQRRSKKDNLRFRLLHFDANHWKSFIHNRLSAPIGSPSSMSLFDAPMIEHLQYAKQLTAEKQVQEFHPLRGLVTKWHKIRSDNHYLDASCMAGVAASICGARLSGNVADAPNESGGAPVTNFLSRQTGR